MNNKSILILRGTRQSLIDNQNNESLKLEDGQLLYNKTDNYISVGNDEDNSLLKDPIAVKELHGNISSTSKDIQYDYYIKNNSSNNLELYSKNSIIINRAPTLSTGIARKQEVDDEASRAKREESKINSKLDSEISRSTNFDNSHNNIENNNDGSILKNSNNNCKGFKSFLYGNHLTATVDYQAIFGYYNNTSSSALLAVGGGTTDEGKNLFEVSSKESKFNTKLKVSEAPTEDKDVLRWGDLTTQLDGPSGTYLTGVSFDGKTLKYSKGSSTIKVIDNQTGSIVTNVTGDNGHTITLSRSNLSGSIVAGDGEYISSVSLSGLELTGSTEKIPDITTTGTSGSFVTSISASGHEITVNKGDLNGSLPNGGDKNTPIYISNGSPPAM